MSAFPVTTSTAAPARASDAATMPPMPPQPTSRTRIIYLSLRIDADAERSVGDYLAASPNARRNRLSQSDNTVGKKAWSRSSGFSLIHRR